MRKLEFKLWFDRSNQGLDSELNACVDAQAIQIKQLKTSIDYEIQICQNFQLS